MTSKKPTSPTSTTQPVTVTWRDVLAAQRVWPATPKTWGDLPKESR